jgi:galactokinase
MLEVRQFFRKQFGFPPTHAVQAPGRLELLGNHTDYNQGLVLALAIDRAVSIAVSPRSDGRIELVSSAFPDKDKFSAGEITKNPAVPWADYIKGVLLHLRRRGVHYNGFNAAIHSTIPIGAGLSSSAALEVATALAVRRLYPYSLTQTGCATPPKAASDGSLPPLTTLEKIETAKLCQTAESQFVGVNSGLLDQISSLFGKAFHAMEIDCQSLSVELVPMIGEIAIVVCNSGVKHTLASGDYNELRGCCEAAVKALGVKSLRSVEPKFLSAQKKKLSQREYECAYHVVGEIQRVVFGNRALRHDDFKQFGEYMFQSHESSRDFLRNSCAELDLLVALARAHPGCLGARLTGGGFGGATINLVDRSQVEAFNKGIAAAYTERTGRLLQPMICQAVDGPK